MDNKLKLTERELSEIELALVYEYRYKHGTDGHNRLMLIAKLARHIGFEIRRADRDMIDIYPRNLEVIE